jgi:hypothetical protein
MKVPVIDALNLRRRPRRAEPTPGADQATGTAGDDSDALAEVAVELMDARSIHEPLNSHHEAYAVILEELEEYWEEVRKRRAERDPARLREELIQIAAMAVRAAVDCQATPRGVG